MTSKGEGSEMPPMTPSDKETGKQAVRHVETSSSWRAVCGERRKHGSEGAVGKVPLDGNSLAAYPTTLAVMFVAYGRRNGLQAETPRVMES